MDLSQATLKAELDYRPDTGEFFWRESGSGRKMGVRAGCEHAGNGGRLWRRIVLNGKEYGSAKLAWLYMTGKYPNFAVDHIDGDSLNDAWSNLRRGDFCVDQRNAKLNRRSKSGLAGVVWYEKHQVFKVTIGVGKGEAKYLGWTPDKFEACCLRKRAELFYGYGPSHGKQ